MDGAGDKPERKEIPPEQQTVADIQRRHNFGSKLPHAAPPRKQPLEMRLREQRRKLVSSIVTTCRIGLVPLGCLGWIIGYAVVMFLEIFLSEVLYSASSSSYSLFDSGGFIAVPLAVTTIVAAALYLPQRMIARQMVKNAYATTWQAVQYTDVLLMIAQEDQHRYIRERIDNTFALRWISPPIPRTFEQHLEYAACYFQTYLTLCHRAELTTRTTLLNGSLPWFVGQRSCCALGILSGLMTQYGCMIFWYIGGGVYLQRLGRELALVDSLLFDVPQELGPKRVSPPPLRPGA